MTDEPQKQVPRGEVIQEIYDKIYDFFVKELKKTDPPATLEEEYTIIERLKRGLDEQMSRLYCMHFYDTEIKPAIISAVSEILKGAPDKKAPSDLYS